LRLVEEVMHPALGALKQLANPVKMDALGGRSVRLPPPQLGEHTREALCDYGFSGAQIEQWLQDALVFQAKQSQISKGG
jgi:crotonobetainyl-CoA:carnitine CoA-transferase CaiB-like acyl-CoA transferase